MNITAQDLYDRRDERGEISGNDLHDLFQALTGDPSPAGRTQIDATRLTSYAQAKRSTYAAHKAGDGIGGEYLLDTAAFCESFTR